MASVNELLCKSCRSLSPFTEETDVLPAAKRTKYTETNEKVDHKFSISSPNESCEANSTTASSSPVCQQCLGLLDMSFQEKLMHEVVTKFEAERYVGLDSFQLCIQISPTLSLQHRICTMWLKQSVTSPDAETESSNASDDDSIKDNIKTNFIDMLSLKLGLKPKVGSPFQILLDIKHREADEMSKRLLAYKNIKPTRKRTKKKPNGSEGLLTISNIQSAIAQCTYDDLDRLGMLPHQTAYSTYCSVESTFTHNSVFIAGRYNKYSRTLSQTPWILDGTRKVESSVQDLICDQLKDVLRYDVVKFSSSGREDVDVRMLGPGRPFLLELLNPRVLNLTSHDFAEAQKRINVSGDAVQVNGLCHVRSDSSKLLKDGEERKKKTYSALICCSEPIVTDERVKFLDDIHDLKLSQKTPIRVLHRRSLAVRERTIYSMKVSMCIDSNHFRLSLVTEAGTYIKEFVHGDFGRTTPNLCTLLGCDVDIKALDVTDLELDWPPNTDK